MNLTTATPQEIDAQLYKLQIADQNATAKLAHRRELYARLVKLGRDMQAIEVDNEIEGLVAQVQEIAAAARPLNAEFQRRGGWTRAFLVVTSGRGHVHRTMACTTCYPTTQFHWLTEMSDHDEQEIVDAAGERACTVCYASAPVELRLDRKTTLFTEDEKLAHIARAEREAKKAAANAAQIVVQDYSEFDRKRDKTFKTERAVTNMIASELSSLVAYGTDHPSSNEWLHNIAAGRQALADNGIDYDYDKVLANARKKYVKEAVAFRASAQYQGWVAQGIIPAEDAASPVAAKY